MFARVQEIVHLLVRVRGRNQVSLGIGIAPCILVDLVLRLVGLFSELTVDFGLAIRGYLISGANGAFLVASGNFWVHLVSCSWDWGEQ